jgi:hypothetical protein
VNDIENVFHETETCPTCDRLISESIREGRPHLGGVQRCCGGVRATYVVEEVPTDTTLAGFRVGERVACDLYRGGVQDDDGVTRGSKLVTKAGRVEEVSIVATYRNVSVRFDDGDFQVCGAGALDGAEPGYPCAAIRRLSAQST